MAASISTQLRPDETILYQTSLKPIIMVVCGICLLIAAFFLVMLALNPGSFLQEFFQRDPNKPMGRDDHIFFSGVAIFFIFLFYLSVKYLYDYFYCEVAVTNQRIIGNIPTAFIPFWLQPLDIPLTELQYVYTAYYGGTSYGYVIVVNRLGGKTIFRNFADPEELRRQIIQDRVLEKEPPQQVQNRRLIGIFCSILFIVTSIICYGYILPLLESTSKGKAPPPQTAPSAAQYVNQGVKEKDPHIKIQLYTKAIELNPNYAVAYNNRGYAQLTQKNLGYALRDLNQAIALNPNYALAYNNRGKVQFQRKKYDLAMMDFDRAIALKPDYAAAYYFRAAIYQQQGDIQQAQVNYTKAKSLDPKLPDLNIEVK